MISWYEMRHLGRKVASKGRPAEAFEQFHDAKVKVLQKWESWKWKLQKRTPRHAQGSRKCESRATEAPCDFPSAVKGSKKLQLWSNSASELISKKYSQSKKVEIS